MEESLRKQAGRRPLQSSPSDLSVACLFHDIAESQYMDLDKTIASLVPDAALIKTHLDKAGTEIFLETWNKLYSDFSGDFFPFSELTLPHESKMFVDCVDKIELHWQTLTYVDKGQLTHARAQDFLDSTFSKLNDLKEEFLFVKVLQEEGLLTRSATS
jgi:5'-deoxynucleotidase YfbR-like HD superfamily hydrolase